MKETKRRLQGKLFPTGGTRLLLLSVLIGNLVFLTGCGINPLSGMTGSSADVAPSNQRELVLGVQEMLLDKGFNPGPIDGVDGPSTQTALRQFQTARGFLNTGQVTSEAYNQLAADGRPRPSSTYHSSAAQQMRNDSRFANQGYLEACATGAMVGVIGGWVSGGSDNRSERVAIGAAAGCIAAMGANYWLQGERQQAAYKEEDMNQMLATIKEENQKLSGLVTSSKAVIAEDRKKIGQIDSAYQSKQISLEEAKRQMAEVDDNKAHLEMTLANLEKRKQSWNTLGNEVRASQSTSASNTIDIEIASLENKITVLKSELGFLEQARRVSAIG